MLLLTIWWIAFDALKVVHARHLNGVVNYIFLLVLNIDYSIIIILTLSYILIRYKSFLAKS